jgi:hypothetical protein
MQTIPNPEKRDQQMKLENVKRHSVNSMRRSRKYSMSVIRRQRFMQSAGVAQR